jgi:hypothetical protein
VLLLSPRKECSEADKGRGGGAQLLVLTTAVPDFTPKDGGCRDISVRRGSLRRPGGSGGVTSSSMGGESSGPSTSIASLSGNGPTNRTLRVNLALCSPRRTRQFGGTTTRDNDDNISCYTLRYCPAKAELDEAATLTIVFRRVWKDYILSLQTLILVLNDPVPPSSY